MLTPEEVMQKLGIEPWDVHYDKMQKWKEQHALKETYTPEQWESQKDRMTGRSTRMYVSLLCAISAGMRVYIKASSYVHGIILARNAKHLAGKLGLDDKLILLRPAPGAVEFQDHSFWNPKG